LFFLFIGGACTRVKIAAASNNNIKINLQRKA